MKIRFFQFPKAFKRKPLRIKVSYGIVFLFLITAIFADFLAYPKPFFAIYQGQVYFPILYDYLIAFGIGHWSPALVNTDWHTLKLDFAIWTLIPYSPQDQNFTDMQLHSPLFKEAWRASHFLGTDHLGRDTLSGLIHGSRFSLFIAFISTFLSSLIGGTIGIMAGYWGDDRLKISIGTLCGAIAGILTACYYALYIRKFAWLDALNHSLIGLIKELIFSSVISFVCMVTGIKIGRLLNKIPFLNKSYAFPADFILSRIIEIPLSIPIFLLLITIMGIIPAGMLSLIIVIGLLQWMPIATLSRAEFLKLKSQYYAQSAEAMGLPPYQVIIKHLLPNAMPALSVIIAFTIAGTILTESALSFLGIGLSPETVTWGSMLSASRSYHSAWWLALFPGLCVFLTVLSLNYIAEDLSTQNDRD